MIVCIYNVPANRANWSAIRVIKEAKPVAVVDGELYTIVNKGTVVVYGPGPLPLTEGERYYLAAFSDKPDPATNRYPCLHAVKAVYVGQASASLGRGSLNRAEFSATALLPSMKDLPHAAA